MKRRGMGFLRVFAAVLFVLGATTIQAAELPRPGDYLEARFVDGLKRTRSPLKAFHASESPQGLTVSREDGIDRVLVNLNWHEGYDLLFRDGQFLRSDIEGEKVVLNTKTPSYWEFGTNRFSGRYVFVENVERFVARHSLVGKYEDRRGRTYEFRDDGTASFPERDFHYSILLDFVFDQHDFVADTDAGIDFSFRHEGGVLVLYPVLAPGEGPQRGQPDFAHPMARLRRLGYSK